VTGLLRLLELVRRDLAALDARAEIGGADPEDPRLVWVPHAGGFRVVVVFAEAPTHPEALRARLLELVESFAGVEAPAVRGDVSPARRLDLELARLADRVGAACAFVVDRESPVLWGTSGVRNLEDGVDVVARIADVIARGADVEALARLESEVGESQRGLDPWTARFLEREVARCHAAGESYRRELSAALALWRVRERWESELTERHAGFGVHARRFAGTYALVLAFDAPFSELHAEALALRALPLVERLVLALPPVEPPGKPGKVVRLRAPR